MDLGVFVLMELSGGSAVLQTIAQVLCVVGFVGAVIQVFFDCWSGSRVREKSQKENRIES
jgi:hypothetical protein